MAVTFTAANNLSVTGYNFNSNHTICGWFRPNTTVTGFIAVRPSNNNGGADVMAFDYSSGPAEIQAFGRDDGGTNTFYHDASGWQKNNWHFVAIRRTAINSLQLFIDGIQAGTVSTDYTGRGAAGLTFEIGMTGFQGDIAHVRVWTTNLTDAELQTEMGSATAVKAASLWAEYRMTNAAGVTTDSSGNGRTLTPTGSFSDAGYGPPIGQPIPGIAQAQAALGTSTNTLTGFRVPTGANRLLVVGAVSNDPSNDPRVTSVTYGGTGLTKAIEYPTGASPSHYAALYYLINPPVGAANVVVTYNAVEANTCISPVSLSWCDQSAPIAGTATNSNTSSAHPTLTFGSTNSNEIILDCLDDYFSTGTVAPDAGQVVLALLNTNPAGSDQSDVSWKPCSGGSNSIGWTGGSGTAGPLVAVRITTSSGVGEIARMFLH